MNHPIPTSFITVERFWLTIILTLMIVGILLIERLIPSPSSAIVVMGVLVAYGAFMGLANIEHQRWLSQRKLIKLPNAPQPTLSEWPYVSIVVPAHNEATVIQETVENLLALEYPAFELWVVDDRSSDETPQALKAIKEKLNDERFHFYCRSDASMPGKSAVLNDAFEHVKGELILVVDADGRLETDFLTKAVPVVMDPSVGAVQVRKTIANDQLNWLTRCQAIEYMMDAQIQDGRDTIRGAVELRGNGQLIKRDALESVDGWTDESITDDLDLSTKLHLAGWDVRFLPNVQVREEGVVEFISLLKQRRRWAEGSLKRYLSYGLNIVASSRVSKRAQIDMIFYFIQFVFPLWLFLDLAFQGGEWLILGAPKHLLSSMLVLPLFGLFLLGSGYAANRRFDRTPFLQCWVEGLMTALFLIVVWIPVVLWITFKVLFKADQGAYNWGKTPRAQTYADQNAPS